MFEWTWLCGEETVHPLVEHQLGIFQPLRHSALLHQLSREPRQLQNWNRPNCFHHRLSFGDVLFHWFMSRLWDIWGLHPRNLTTGSPKLVVCNCVDVFPFSRCYFQIPAGTFPVCIDVFGHVDVAFVSAKSLNARDYAWNKFQHLKLLRFRFTETKVPLNMKFTISSNHCRVQYLWLDRNIPTPNSQRIPHTKPQVPLGQWH